MTGFNPPLGNSKHGAKAHHSPAALINQGKRVLKRYLMIGTGISSTAIGLALIVSFIAATQGGSSHPVLAAGQNVEVNELDGRTESKVLEPARQAVAAQREPLTAAFDTAAPAPALEVEASPPASEIDAPQSEVASANSLPSVGLVTGVNVTFYDCLVQGFCGAMYNGEQVYEGAAACSWNLPLGTRFVIEGDPTGRTYVCADRGYLPDTWVDIFFHSPDDGWAWQQAVGRYSSILIISIPLS